MKKPASGVLLSFLTIAGLTVAATAAIGQDGGMAKISVWSGVYTQAQSKRGEEVHITACASCHGPGLDGAGQPDMPASPGIAGTTLFWKWKGRTVGELFTYVRTEMPPDTPGTLTDQQTVDAIAHMLAVSEIPAGEKEL